MLVMFFVLGWKPQMAKLDELNKQKVEEEAKIQAAKNMLIMLEGAKKSTATAEIDLIKMANRVPADPELPSLIVEVQNMANDAGVELVSLRPGELVPAGELSELKVSTVTRGSYVALVDFLRRIEKAPRALKVSSIDIRVREYPDLELNLTISAFTMGGDGQIAPPPVQSASVK